MATKITSKEHGTLREYRKGCRCQMCKAANASYQRAYHAGLREKANQLKSEAEVHEIMDDVPATVNEGDFDEDGNPLPDDH